MYRNSSKLHLSALVALVTVTAALVGCAAPPTRWNVLIVTFDTTRADHLGPYGHPQTQTPVLDQLALDGVVFEQASAAVPITLPSHSTLMTGKVPFAHGVRDNGLFSLGEQQTTLAEILASRGWRTAAAVGSFPLTGQFGIGQGFELFDDRIGADFEDLYGDRIFPKDRLFFDERQAGRVNEALLPWIRDHVATRSDEPFFAWAHYFDPHHPHEPPPPYNQTFAHDLYLGEIAYADESFGVLLEQLEELGVADDTLVILTSDHGEGIGEHGESTHSMLIYQSTLHVPLIFRVPGIEGGQRVATRVGTVDVLPTVLDLLGLDTPSDLQGSSLRGHFDPASPAPPARPIYGETLSPRLTREWGELRSLTVDGLKYIHGPRPELYDLTEDPRELHDLAGVRAGDAARLETQLGAYLQRHVVDGLDASVDVDEATARRLQALGYLQSDAAAAGPLTEVLRREGEPPQDHAEETSAYSQAKTFLFSGKALQAREFINELLRSDPGNAHYLELLANAELQLGRTPQAIEILESLIEDAESSYPPREKILPMLAGLEQQLGHLDRARSHLMEAEAIQPTAAGQYRLAKLAEVVGEPEVERTALEAALEIDEDFVPARINLGIRYAQAGQTDAAGRAFERAVTADPYDARAAFNYATFLVTSDQLERAVDLYRRALRLRPAYPAAALALFELEFELGLLTEARATAQRLAILAPGHPDTRIALELTAGVSP